MRVKCVICEDINQLADHTPLAKKLRNHPINTYMCNICSARITERTNERLATGKFIFYRSSHMTEKEF